MLVKLRSLIIFLVCGLLLAPAPARASSIPLDEYWQRLAQTRTLIDDLETASLEAPASPEEAGIQLEAAATDWAAITSVTLPTGEIVPVDHSYLVTQLRHTPPDLAHLKQLFATLAAAQKTWSASQHTAADLESLTKILTRPEFQWQTNQPSLLDLLWEKIRETLWRFLSWLLPDSVALSLSTEGFGYLISGLAAVLMVAALAYMVYSLALNFAAETEVLDENAPAEILTADLALKRAHTLSAAGDYRTAVRYLYLSALLVLDERGLLRYDRSLTNREYLKTVAHLPEVAAILGEVVEVFDRVWYGYQPLDATGFNQYAARVAELQSRR